MEKEGGHKKEKTIVIGKTEKIRKRPKPLELNAEGQLR